MKRFGLIPLAMLLAAMMAGCGGDGGNDPTGADANPVGSWTRTWTWEKSIYFNGTGPLYIFKDGTFSAVASGVVNGTWSVDGNAIKLVWTISGVTCLGTIEKDTTMSGTIEHRKDGAILKRGVWSATRIVTTP